MACLASRFPYGSTITAEKLSRVERLEDFLRSRGFRLFRARHHESILRFELAESEIERFMASDVRKAWIELTKAEGFKYVTLDLEGYRTGSMNEVLTSRT
jgi:uncharacterized protein